MTVEQKEIMEKGYSVTVHRKFTLSKIADMNREEAKELLSKEIVNGREIGIARELIEEHERILATL